MKVNKQKPNKTGKKSLISIILVIICIICMVFYLLVLWPIEDIMTNEAEIKDTPTVSGDARSSSTTDNAKGSDNTNSSSSVKEPTKTPGKTPAQYENESVDDKPAYDNEQFRIPEEE